MQRRESKTKKTLTVKQISFQVRRAQSGISSIFLSQDKLTASENEKNNLRTRNSKRRGREAGGICTWEGQEKYVGGSKVSASCHLKPPFLGSHRHTTRFRQQPHEQRRPILAYPSPINFLVSSSVSLLQSKFLI